MMIKEIVLLFVKAIAERHPGILLLLINYLAFLNVIVISIFQMLAFTIKNKIQVNFKNKNLYI